MSQTQKSMVSSRSPYKTQGSTLKRSRPQKMVAPEDNWELVGNPDKYMDVLP